ncbi:MAG: type II secretion system protein [Deferribacteres bacterium]|nr:type II secretion system protein [Deferribacteres bacterium]
MKAPCGKPQMQAREAGFTLIEVIVAMAILSITFVLIMQLFSSGLRASRTSCDFTRAVVHAKDKMEELSGEPVQESGEFEDGFKWETEVQAYKELEEAGLNLLEIKVKVSWADALNKERSVELTSLKLVENEK